MRKLDHYGLEGIGVLIVAAVLVALCGGCSGTALDRHVTAAASMRVGLNAAAETIDVVCDPDRVETLPDAQQFASRCVHAFEGHDAARAAWLTWAEALIAADGDKALLQQALSLTAPMLDTYAELAGFLADFGVSLPTVPALLTGGE